jgi:hypothetical protein
MEGLGVDQPSILFPLMRSPPPRASGWTHLSSQSRPRHPKLLARAATTHYPHKLIKEHLVPVDSIFQSVRICQNAALGQM